jgi:pimeloyl-ACP methyl ester carboxylesterase
LLLAWSIVEILSRNWAIAIIVSTIVMLVVLPALVLLRYVNISLNIMRTTSPPLARSPLDFVRLIGEPVAFPAYDGLPLQGMVIRGNPEVQRRGLIVFAHEYCADMYSCARYCRPLQEAGYDIFTFDFRGHGQSGCPPDYTPRQWVSDRDLHDMNGAIAFVVAWLEDHGLPRDIGVFGISRGACAAILAAEVTPEIRAIVSDGAFSTDTTIEALMKRWAYIFARVRLVYENHHPAFWRFLRWVMIQRAAREFRCRFPSVLKAIRRMSPCPILFIHGEKDSYLPVEQSLKLYALAPQPKHLWIAPGAKHNQAAVLHSAFYAVLSVGFFDRYLAGRPAPVLDAGLISASPSMEPTVLSNRIPARSPAPPAMGPESRVLS